MCIKMEYKKNYQIELEKKLSLLQVENEVPSLLLHSCCAPCSSYVLEYLSDYFYITVFFYNPNIYPAAEYERRVNEQQKLILKMPFKYPVRFLEGRYEPQEFFELAKGYEHCLEGGERCERCYRQRLKETARVGAERGFDYFTTTLTISPLKKADKLNEIGCILQEKYNISYLTSDFKKKNGYKRSVELSYQYNLYRQNYCGCAFSRTTIA